MLFKSKRSGIRPSDLRKWEKLIASNKEMDDTMKIVNPFGKTDVSQTIQNEAKEQKGGFFSMLQCKK